MRFLPYILHFVSLPFPWKWTGHFVFTLIRVSGVFFSANLFGVKPGFHMIVGDRSRSLGSLVNCSAIVTIIWKPNFLFCQRSPTIPATANDRNSHDRWDRIRVYLCDRSDRERSWTIVNDRQRSQKVNGNHQCSDRNDRNDPSDHMEIIAQQSQLSWRSQRSYVSCDLNDPDDYVEIKLQQL